ncbi:MAG: glycosyltransferase family 4 protein, partial [Clostridiales bacterium]|nr:glycosyltransferase family 4 protein [Clostridiales bacterium]
PDAVQNMFDAFLVSAGQVDEFVSAIQRLSLDTELRIKLINNGLISAGNFTIESETKKMMDHVFANLTFPIKPGD